MLHLFHAETPLGPWIPHRRNPVRSDCRAARPAGRVFSFGGALYRPAQDCSGSYGRAIAIQKVLRLDTQEYREEHVAEVEAHWDPRALRTHTMNRDGRLFVADALIHRSRWK